MVCDTGETADNDPGARGRYNGRQTGFHGLIFGYAGTLW